MPDPPNLLKHINMYNYLGSFERVIRRINLDIKENNFELTVVDSSEDHFN